MWRCFDCKKAWWTKERPRKCDKCGSTFIVSYYDYYGEREEK